LFTSASTGAYYYSKGWNYRAYIAYIIGIAPNFYGFLGVFGVDVTTPATRMYYFAYPMGLVLSFCSYWALNVIDPPTQYEAFGTWREPQDYVAESDLEDGMVVVDGIDAQSRDLTVEEKGMAVLEKDGASA
jgi:NCS1 family nucleobase:cation symporter-1